MPHLKINNANKYNEEPGAVNAALWKFLNRQEG